jgi:hypothetical protein
LQAQKEKAANSKRQRMQKRRAAEQYHHRKLQPQARGYHIAASMPVSQPTSKWSEEHERCDEEQRDHADQPARLTGGKKPLDEADQN